MFARIQAREYRCLRHVDQVIGRFRVLVGPNGSGKTTFLDVIGFLGDLVRGRGDVPATVMARSRTFENLTWLGASPTFQLAVEAKIPEAVASAFAEDKRSFTHVRYEIEIGLDDDGEIGLNHEVLWLLIPEVRRPQVQRELFPAQVSDVRSILAHQSRDRRVAVTNKPGGNANYYPEGKSGYAPSFKLGRTRSALANIPADVDSFPVSTWFRDLLEQGVQTLVLNSQLIKQPSAPGLPRRFLPDGSNLPWIIAELKKEPDRFSAWLAHVRTALEDIKDIDTIERPEDRHRYLVLEYANGARVPSWLVSDGTLRLLALTVPAYLRGLSGTYLIEEPENGIHPRAIETVVQSLSSVYDGQVLVATHSPVTLNMVEVEDVLCFAKDAAGATDIVSGDQHPKLRAWKEGEPDLGTLFASGILS